MAKAKKFTDDLGAGWTLDQAVSSFNHIIDNAEEIIMAQMIAERDEAVKKKNKEMKK